MSLPHHLLQADPPLVLFTAPAQQPSHGWAGVSQLGKLYLHFKHDLTPLFSVGLSSFLGLTISMGQKSETNQQVKKVNY